LFFSLYFCSVVVIIFFFSSRRRHTRFSRDWSSDVCSSDLDGVYDADPVKVPTAKRYERLNYLDVISRDLGVMDHAAISLARENSIPVLVFSIAQPGSFAEVVQGRGSFTIVTDEE